MGRRGGRVMGSEGSEGDHAWFWPGQGRVQPGKQWLTGEVLGRQPDAEPGAQKEGLCEPWRRAASKSLIFLAVPRDRSTCLLW